MKSIPERLRLEVVFLLRGIVLADSSMQNTSLPHPSHSAPLRFRNPVGRRYHLFQLFCDKQRYGSGWKCKLEVRDDLNGNFLLDEILHLFFSSPFDLAAAIFCRVKGCPQQITVKPGSNFLLCGAEICTAWRLWLKAHILLISWSQFLTTSFM